MIDMEVDKLTSGDLEKQINHTVLVVAALK